MGEWRTGRQSGPRVSVDEAARALGLSVDAIRKRVQRDTIRYEKDAAGRVRIILDESETLQDKSQDTPGQPDARAELIEELRARVGDLREQLQAERQGHAEARRLLAAALERIPPAIEAPSDERESPTEATEQPGRVEPQTQVEGAQEPRESHEMAMPEVGGGPLPRDQQTPSERPWWRRMFSG
jgi:hypothetical protein